MISLALEGGVAIATLSRPPVNAINDEWLDRFGEVLDEVERAPAVKVLWIRSRERVFCAGADLALIRARFDTEAGRQAMADFSKRLQALYTRLAQLGQVSIAEIGGAALGGGFELALSCDLRTVADTAHVGLPEARLGLLPGAGGTQRLTRICGDAVARRLILGAEVVTGADAAALGLTQWVAPAAELESFTRSVAARIAELPAAALAACKHCIDAGLDQSRDGFAVELAETANLLTSPETRARVRQFLNRKK